MTQVTSEEELNIIIQHISFPFATSQEKITSNVHDQEEDQDEFANFFNHIHTQTKPVDQDKIWIQNSNPYEKIILR